MGDYRRRRQSENKRLWRENLSTQRASKYKREDSTRQRKKRANLSPDSLIATRRRHADYQQKRVSSLTPDKFIEQRQRHAENEWLRVYALPAKEKAILRAEKTMKQRERRARRTEDGRARDRKKDAQRKKDKRKAEKMFQKKLNGYLKDKSNPKPLWLLLVADQCSKRALVFELVAPPPLEQILSVSKHLGLVPEDPDQNFQAQ